MEEAVADRFSDRGSTPLRSIKNKQQEFYLLLVFLDHILLIQIKLGIELLQAVVVGGSGYDILSASGVVKKDDQA